MQPLLGFHHVTAVTANVVRNHAFYTGVLGLRLVKKSVNQDDVSAYHLFYADGKASPGTDLTFFDWPVPPERRGTNSVARTGLRVASEKSLLWWREWLMSSGVMAGPVADRAGRLTFDFDDFEGQRLSLSVDETRGEAHPWEKSPVPVEHQIRGLGPVFLSVPDLQPTEDVLLEVMGMNRDREYTHNPGGDSTRMHVYTTDGGGPRTELHVAVEPSLRSARQGAGAVHHVAFRTPTLRSYEEWAERLKEMGMPSSGPVERYYFKSLYFREPNGILFEIATDEPGFAVDEPIDKLGERLALPPFLEPRRAEIEKGLKPLNGGGEKV